MSVTLDNEDRLEASEVALVEGLGVVEGVEDVEDVVEVVCVAVPFSNPAIGACIVECVSGIGAAVEPGSSKFACILNDGSTCGIVGVGLTVACRTCAIIC